MSIYKDKTVLIADDSPVIISSVRRIILGMGFNDDNIQIAKDPKSILSLSSEQFFDLIICDFEFHDKLNGRQVFEELTYLQRLKPEGVFIMVTGESSAKLVRSIIEVSPDEYILKPFSATQLSNRIMKSVLRKMTLASLYRVYQEKKYVEAIDLCGELLFKYPKYQLPIQKIKAKCLMLTSNFGELELLLKEIIARDGVEWASCELVELYITKKKFDLARDLITSYLDEHPNSLRMHVLSSRIDIHDKNVKQAIHKLTYISNLALNNPERQLALAMLNVADNNLKAASSCFKSYQKLVEGTFLDNDACTYNILRSTLLDIDSNYRLSHEYLKGSIDRVKSDFDSFVMSQQHNLAYADATIVDKNALSNTLINAHIFILEGKINEGKNLIFEALKDNKLGNLSELYHLSYILSLFYYRKEFNDNSLRFKKKVMELGDIGLVSESVILMYTELAIKYNTVTKDFANNLSSFKDNMEKRDFQSALRMAIKLYESNIYDAEAYKSVINVSQHLVPDEKLKEKLKPILRRSYRYCKLLYTYTEFEENKLAKMYSNAISIFD
ncbi:response regulator [Vibrio mediterranei]|uniref:response regulator n=1 Tax=Vibrio mediterranei TaxID=689 RepID=UPI0015E74900|nr:response regulator [Vibrio mediterranei]